MIKRRAFDKKIKSCFSRKRELSYSCYFVATSSDIRLKKETSYNMNKLCLSTYLSVLTIYRCPQDSGQLRIMNGLIKCLYDNPETINASRVSHIKSGDSNIPRTIRDEIQKRKYQNPRYLENFKANVEYLLDPNKISDIYKTLRYIALTDEDITDDSIIDYVSQTKKSNLNYTGNRVDFIAGVFLYVIRVKNNKTQKYASLITNEFCENAIKEFSKLEKGPKPYATTIVLDSDIPSQAKAFCRKYEDSINLLPLCQIANIVNPRHNHVNKIYDEYCDCSDALKVQIMKEINCPMIQSVDKYALYGLLRRFEDDIEKMELSSRDNLYMFSQYVVNSLSFEDEPVKSDLTFFPIAPSRLFPNHNTSFLSQFINDYLFYKDKDMGVSLPVPLNWMWVNLDFGNCSTKDLIFWLNLFITSSCYDVQAYFKYDNKEDLNIPNIEDAKTIEDLFFLSLLMLYDTYMNS